MDRRECNSYDKKKDDIDINRICVDKICIDKVTICNVDIHIKICKKHKKDKRNDCCDDSCEYESKEMNYANRNFNIMNDL
ncbi:hypothetical protein [Alphaentomopoxvirus acuprea]|uniref:Uncharacterized protein n=1 Tax=Alphaentomopoxvirus acuprea TaxID=62099 RepID=W6JKV9_9POXV|nr:hypothetical protein BA82_gp070 [Anomala cuprea entomopoxvirus]BAO49430.1 hypothetical protein [Anomala cuprea entomopoxvirus]